MDTNFLQYRERKTIVGGIHTTAVYFLLVLNIGYVTAHVRERVAPVLGFLRWLPVRFVSY